MTASLLTKFTYLLFLSLATANQTSDRLRKLDEAFVHWIPIRRHTKEELEHLETNLNRLAKPSIATRTLVGAALGGVLTGVLTFGASLMAAAGAGIGALMGATSSYLSPEEEKKLRLPEVQVAIEKDREACIRLQELLDSLNRTFSSTSSAGATQSKIVQYVSFADPSVLPRDITQLVKSSLDRHGSTSPIVAEIKNVLDNLKCPDDVEIGRLVPESLAESKKLDLWTKVRVVKDFDSAETECF